MLYNTVDSANIEGIENYICTIKPVDNTAKLVAEKKAKLSASFEGIPFWSVLKGIMNDNTIELPFGVALTNEGAIGAGGVAGWIKKGIEAVSQLNPLNEFAGPAKKANKIIDGVTKGVEALTGINPAERQAVYSVVMPKSWSKPSVTFKCTYYSGMKIGKDFITPPFNEFCKRLLVPLLPAQKGMLITAIMESTQVSYDTIVTLIAEGIGAGGKGAKDLLGSFGFSVEIGKVLLIPYGLWMKDAKVETPTIFDAKGKPLVWNVSYEFEYYKQPTIDEVQRWLI